MGWRALSLAAALLLAPGSAQAICSVRPSITQEVRSSDAIVLGRVLGHRLVAAPDDPIGIEATVYTLRVLQRHKGSTARTIEIESPNTSSRFPMTQAREYLLFLRKDGSRYWVDACGHSARANRQLRARIEAGLREQPS